MRPEGVEGEDAQGERAGEDSTAGVDGGCPGASVVADQGAANESGEQTGQHRDDVQQEQDEQQAGMDHEEPPILEEFGRLSRQLKRLLSDNSASWLKFGDAHVRAGISAVTRSATRVGSCDPSPDQGIVVSNLSARDQFFADLDRLRQEAGSPEVQVIARGTGLREATIRGWFPTEPGEHRVAPRHNEQLVTLVTYFLRRSSRLAPQASLDRRTQEDWLRRRRAAASDNATRRGASQNVSSIPSNSANVVVQDNVTVLGWGGIAAVLDTDTDLPRVSELDAYRLGAAPTRFGAVGQSANLDPYVTRTADDVDARIAGALRGSAMVLVIGWSMVGKTRTLYEAVRHELPDARVLVPERTALQLIPTHPAYSQCDDPIVVWLDDLDEYLQTEQKLTPTWLTFMLTAHPGRTVVVATMRREAFDRLEADTGEPTKEIRALLNHATQIELESTSENDFEHIAAKSSYPGLNLEQYRALGYGLGEVLAGAPALLARYNRADPRLRAVIEVAIDWRRIGRSDPIPEPILIQLSALRARTLRPSLGLDNSAIAATILTAREPVEATARIAALQTVWSNETDCGYRAFDYLVAADDGQHGGRQRPIPETFWDEATQNANPSILLRVGATAHIRGYRDALAISRRAALTGDTTAMVTLGAFLIQQGEIDEAETWYRRAADSGDTTAMILLSMILQQYGLVDEAETWLRRAADAGDINAMHGLAHLLKAFDKLEEAEAWYQRAANIGHTNAMAALGNLLKDRGKLEEAEVWLRRGANARDPNAMESLGFLLHSRNDFDEAETWYRRAVDNTDPSVTAMLMLGMVLHQCENLDEAETWYRRAADKGAPMSMLAIGMIHLQRSDFDEAELWFHRAADTGDTMALATLRGILGDDGSKKAEIWELRAAESPTTRDLLHRARQGEVPTENSLRSEGKQTLSMSLGNGIHLHVIAPHAKP